MPLLLRGDRIRRIGLELIQAAESGKSRPTLVTDDGPHRALFGQTPVAAPTFKRLNDDGGEGALNGRDSSGRASTTTEYSDGGG